MASAEPIDRHAIRAPLRMGAEENLRRYFHEYDGRRF